jgi:hypothetical protein
LGCRIEFDFSGTIDQGYSPQAGITHQHIRATSHNYEGYIFLPKQVASLRQLLSRNNFQQGICNTTYPGSRVTPQRYLRKQAVAKKRA